MEREITQKLIQWRDSPERRPLLLEGARQTGKTFLLKEIFGKRYYENIAYLNLQNPAPEIQELFNGSIQPKRIISQLELLLHQDISPGKTLIIFDEIQEIPRALTSLKYFYEETPEYHIAVAGSLLGVFLHQDTSFPVGKVDIFRLEPMNFREFLWAEGETKLVQHLEQHPEDQLFREHLIDLMHEYFFTGGMPDVVKDWIGNHDVGRAEGIQRRILMDYMRDFSKYTNPSLALKIRQVFDSLPSQFAKRHEKFTYGLVKTGARAREYETAIAWLADAGIIRPVYRIKRGDQLPLKAYTDSSSFKLYFLDLGLFRCFADIPSRLILQPNGIFNELGGFFAEQFVLQEYANSPNPLFYWANDATAEVDFVKQYQDWIVPIEVKSGENVKAKSLRVYREQYSPPLALRYSLKELQSQDDLLNIPLYKIFLKDQLVQEAYTPS